MTVVHDSVSSFNLILSSGSHNRLCTAQTVPSQNHDTSKWTGTSVRGTGKAQVSKGFLTCQWFLDISESSALDYAARLTYSCLPVERWEAVRCAQGRKTGSLGSMLDVLSIVYGFFACFRFVIASRFISVNRLWLSNRSTYLVFNYYSWGTYLWLVSLYYFLWFYIIGACCLF
jgi:hypothetical protein